MCGPKVIVCTSSVHYITTALALLLPHPSLQGVSRSASVVTAYLMKTQKMGLAEALSYLQERRPSVNPHEAFLEQLAQYESRLQVSCDPTSVCVYDADMFNGEHVPSCK